MKKTILLFSIFLISNCLTGQNTPNQIPMQKEFWEYTEGKVEFVTHQTISSSGKLIVPAAEQLQVLYRVQPAPTEGLDVLELQEPGLAAPSPGLSVDIRAPVTIPLSHRPPYRIRNPASPSGSPRR